MSGAEEKLGITTTDRSENWKLQGYLFDRMIELLRNRYHKTPMFWYELDFKKIQPGCVTFAWRSGLTEEALKAAVENNARIMLCPGEHCYFDYPMAKGDMPEVNWGMPVTTLKDTYRLDPGWGMGEDFEKIIFLVWLVRYGVSALIRLNESITRLILVPWLWQRRAGVCKRTVHGKALSFV